MKIDFNTSLLKFGAVGLSGMIIDFGITWLCKEKFRFNKYIANSIGFITAVSSNFIFNRVWTFELSGTHGATTQFIKFIFVSLAGLAINNLILYLLVKKATLNFYLSKLFAIGIVFFWNYFVNLFFTFN